jgi:hypothetical protein
MIPLIPPNNLIPVMRLEIMRMMRRQRKLVPAQALSRLSWAKKMMRPRRLQSWMNRRTANKL